MWNIYFRANCSSDVINWRASFFRLEQLDFVRVPRPNDVSSSQFWMAYWTCTTSDLYVQFYWSFELYRLVVRHRCSWSWSKVSRTSFRAISRHPSVNSFIHYDQAFYPLSRFFVIREYYLWIVLLLLFHFIMILFSDG